MFLGRSTARSAPSCCRARSRSRSCGSSFCSRGARSTWCSGCGVSKATSRATGSWCWTRPTCACPRSTRAATGTGAAWMYLQAGTGVLRRIAGFFQIPLDGNELSISREEFGLALDSLAAAGLPVVRERDAAWARFSQRRAEYDCALLGLRLSRRSAAGGVVERPVAAAAAAADLSAARLQEAVRLGPQVVFPAICGHRKPRPLRTCSGRESVPPIIQARSPPPSLD